MMLKPPSLIRFTAGADARIVAVEGPCEEIFDAPAGSFLGVSLVSLGLFCGHPEHRRENDYFTPCDHRVLKRVRFGGRERCVLLSCHCLPAGNPREACRVELLDVSDPTDMLQRILLAKHEVEEIFDASSQPSLLCDAQGTVVRANRALIRELRTRYRDILNRPYGEVLPKELAEALASAFEEILAGRESAHAELCLSDERILKVRLFPVFRWESVPHVLIRCQDVTEKRALEERTLHNDRLCHLGELAASITHEMMTPVSYIAWNLERLDRHVNQLQDRIAKLRLAVGEGQNPDADARAALADAFAAPDLDDLLAESGDLVRESLDGCAHVKKTVSTLRSFSHPGETDAERTTMEECLDQALIIGQTRIRGNRAVERRCEGKTPVLANRQQIVQVLLNLLLNAVDATEEGGRIVARSFRDGVWAVLEISDEGTGIAPENLERIFESFYTTKPSGKGTGLGLWLSRMIVRAHGGHLRVASEPGKGSTFRIELPCEGSKEEKGGDKR